MGNLLVAVDDGRISLLRWQLVRGERRADLVGVLWGARTGTHIELRIVAQRWQRLRHVLPTWSETSLGVAHVARHLGEGPLRVELELAHRGGSLRCRRNSRLHEGSDPQEVVGRQLVRLELLECRLLLGRLERAALLRVHAEFLHDLLLRELGLLLLKHVSVFLGRPRLIHKQVPGPTEGLLCVHGALTVQTGHVHGGGHVDARRLAVVEGNLAVQVTRQILLGAGREQGS